MSSNEILIKEQCGTLGEVNSYASGQSNKIYKLKKESEPVPKFIINQVTTLLKDIFLPYGYPDSVSKDYFDYQIWDTIQAFCSTISGTFTTQAVLKGVGVGNAEATPLAAAITWVAKDGTGMIGRIIFAWLKGSSLDANCKKWRLVADFLNDGAMFIELLIPYCTNFAIHLLCMTTAMKAIVGVAGGATRASITEHQAIKGNMADVSAKDGSQETFVNLIASIIGIFLLAVMTEAQYQWALFMMFTLIHLIANYFAVSSLVFTNLNNTRLVLLLQSYLKYDSLSNPVNLSKKEPVILGIDAKIRDLCSFDIKLGTSLKHLPQLLNANELKTLTDTYENKKYLLVPDLNKRTIYVALANDETPDDVLTAYFHAVMLSLTLCLYNKIPMNVSTKRQLHHVTPIVRLTNAMKDFTKNESNIIKNVPLQMLQCLNDFIKQEVTMFFTALKVNGWSLETHSLEIGEWRCNWVDRISEKKHQ